MKNLIVAKYGRRREESKRYCSLGNRVKWAVLINNSCCFLRFSALYEDLVNHELGGSSSSLTAMRESVWSFLRVLCPSFRAMDCNAQFSQIFSRQVFGFLNNEQKHKFLSAFNLIGHCEFCSHETTVTLGSVCVFLEWTHVWIERL